MATKIKKHQGIWLKWPPKSPWRRIRFCAARIIDRHTDLCWCQLVSWALYRDLKFFDGNDDFSSASCKKDCAESGSCYCGKFKREGLG